MSSNSEMILIEIQERWGVCDAVLDDFLSELTSRGIVERVDDGYVIRDGGDLEISESECTALWTDAAEAAESSYKIRCRDAHKKIKL